MRIPRPWHHPLAAGRLLLLSTFPDSLRRPTAPAAARRNACVAALADRIPIPTPNIVANANHSPSPKSHESQFRQRYNARTTA